jgi:hypothetical protein
MTPVCTAPTPTDLLGADLDVLAHDVARDGIAAHARRVADAAARAVAAGARPLLARIVLDPSTPSVAAERAFGHLAAETMRATSTARWHAA